MSNSTTDQTDQHSPADNSKSPADNPKLTDEFCLDSSDLMGNQRELKIRHNGEIYRLRVTRSGKLILHK